MHIKNLFVIIFIFIYSCKERKYGYNNIIKTTKKIVVLKTVDNQLNDKSLLDRNIDVQNIKSQLDYVTTTFLNKKNAIIFPDRKKNNYYAKYFLVKKDDALKIVGYMIIYDSINPYIYDKNTDEFVEITLNKKGIKLYNNKLEVGMEFNDLRKNLGNNYKRKKDLYIYKKDSLIAFFKIKNKKVNKIKIGIYKKNIDENLILSTSKW